MIKQQREYCINQPPSYYEYKNKQIEFDACDRYELIQNIGRGKYSYVFEGIDTKTDDKVIVKILKPVRKAKISREICILKILGGGKNIIRLLNICYDPMTKVPSLVFECISNTTLKSVLKTLSLEDIKGYMFKLF